MNGGGIIISNNSDGRGMMLPEREGNFSFNKLPFISMPNKKKEVGLNPSGNKIIINSKKLNPIKKIPKKKSRKDKLYPLEHYRKIKTSQQFWKKNENPFFKQFNKKNEDEKTILEEVEKYKVQGKNTFKEIIDHGKLNYSDIEYIKTKKLFSAPKTPQKLVTSTINNELQNNTFTANKEEPKENITTIQPEMKEVKVSTEDINNNKNIEEKKNEINNDDNNNINNKEETNKEGDKEKKEIKDPLLEEELDDKENIEDVISYLNGLDYDKYCKDMEIREALTLLKHKMDKEKEEQKNSEEKEKNKVTIEGGEKPEEKEKEKDEEKKDENNNNNNNNKTILPEISNKTPEQNKVEIVDEEELKRKEEIKKYKIAEQIAKTEQMKKVHSVNSIKKLLEREGLDKLSDQAPLRITVIKENPIANMDELQTNKLPFLHSLPLV